MWGHLSGIIAANYTAPIDAPAADDSGYKIPVGWRDETAIVEDEDLIDDEDTGIRYRFLNDEKCLATPWCRHEEFALHAISAAENDHARRRCRKCQYVDDGDRTWVTDDICTPCARIPANQITLTEAIEEAK
ncbi:MAG: hypothetical protein ABIR47_16955 [Candidatus Kapaibacterium sp.]